MGRKTRNLNNGVTECDVNEDCGFNSRRNDIVDGKSSQKRLSLRFPMTLFATFILSPLVMPAMAEGPVNDVVPWPAGIILLAAVLYAALGMAPDELWSTDPSIGIFLWRGIPIISIPTMQRVNWVASACHFVPGIKTAYGVSNFWIRSEDVTHSARATALEKTLEVLSPILENEEEADIDTSLWQITPAGLLSLPSLIPVPSDNSIFSRVIMPSARDFLLFAATDYHAFREWEVRVEWKGGVFSTKGMGASTAFDVGSIEDALPIVAANMVRRPHSQSILRSRARREGDNEYGPYILQLDNIDRRAPICNIDFHSYSAQSAKVTASLDELAESYYRVIQYLKSKASSIPKTFVGRIDVGSTLWIAILGGVVLDSGRLTIQNLPGRWGMRDVSADEAYITRVEAILKMIKNHARKTSFFDIVYSGGISRRPAIPFLLAGVVGQSILCYFLAVGTSAGIWLSVAISNAIFSGKLTDLHSLYFGKMKDSEEPGMKMRVPGKTDLLAIATLDRTAPREGPLRPGLLLNITGLLAAGFGNFYRNQTRQALGFQPFQPTQSWVLYTAAIFTASTSILIAVTTAIQQSVEKTWWDRASLPTRWMIYSSLPCATIVAALSAVFRDIHLLRFWPLLDFVIWISGFPLGMLENGRMISADDNVLHLVLVTRWLMGAVASSISST